MYLRYLSRSQVSERFCGMTDVDRHSLTSEKTAVNPEFCAVFMTAAIPDVVSAEHLHVVYRFLKLFGILGSHNHPHVYSLLLIATNKNQYGV